MGDSDDTTFEDLMASMGVRPLADRSGGAAVGGGATRPQVPPVRGPIPALSRPPPAGHGTSPHAPAGLRSPTGSGPSAITPAAAPLSTKPQPSQAEAELAALRRKLRAVAAERDALQAQLEAVQQQLASSSEAHSEAAAGLEAAQRETAAAADRTDGLDRQRRALQQQLEHLRGEVAEHRRVPVGDLMRKRGLATAREMTDALSGLAVLRPEELLRALVLADTAPLELLLEERIVLSASGPPEPDEDATADAEGQGDAVFVQVPIARSETGERSTLARSFRRLAACCAQAGVASVTLVGGSPPYRRQLRDLAAQHAPQLRLNLVSGTQRRTQRKADADIRNSDLVVIWGATLLHHSVSGLYRGASERLVRVPHRGVAGLLGRLADRLEGEPKRGARDTSAAGRTQEW